MDASSSWLIANAHWLWWVAMALIGGTVGWIESYKIRGAAGQIGALLAAWSRGILIAALLYHLHQATGGNVAVWWFFTGILSVFGRESIRRLFQYGNRRFFGNDRHGSEKDGRSNTGGDP